MPKAFAPDLSTITRFCSKKRFKNRIFLYKNCSSKTVHKIRYLPDLSDNTEIDYP